MIVTIQGFYPNWENLIHWIILNGILTFLISETGEEQKSYSDYMPIGISGDVLCHVLGVILALYYNTLYVD